MRICSSVDEEEGYDHYYYQKAILHKLRQTRSVKKTSLLRSPPLNVLQTRTGDAYVVKAIGYNDQIGMIFQSANLKQRDLLQDVVTADPKVQNFYILVTGIQALLQWAAESVFPGLRKPLHNPSSQISSDQQQDCRGNDR